MTAACIKEVLNRADGLDPSEVEDVIIGCAMPEGPQGYNIARQSSIRAGLPETVPAQTVNRFCSSGLQVAKEFEVSREDQDEFALRSHTRAKEAVNSGLFDEEIVPLDVKLDWVNENGEPQHTETTFTRDEGPRDTSLEKLAKLPAVFQKDGTVTPGNSSQTSDGAAAVVVMEREHAEERGLKPLARFVGFAVGGVRPEIMGMGPSVAIPKVLELTDLSLGDIDLIEFNEAFAAQTLACIREVGLDLEKMNVNGGAIALGHPMGATGTKLTVQLMSEMKRRNSKYGMVTMCIGGGMGAAGIFENLQN
jgi:acetyl-CoA acyltransferase